MSGASAELIRAVIGLALTAAVERGILASNPMKGVKRWRSRGHKAEAFTSAEQHAIEGYIAACGRPWHIGILLSLHTGLKAGRTAGLGMERHRFEPRDAAAHYRRQSGGKGYAFHTESPKSASSLCLIPVPKNIMPLLKKIKRGAESAYVIARADGRRIPTHSYQYAFRVLKKCEVRPLPFHALRHTFGHPRAGGSIDVKTVSEVMGHAGAAFTLSRYAHSMTEHKAKMMDKLGSLFHGHFSLSENMQDPSKEKTPIGWGVKPVKGTCAQSPAPKERQVH